MRCLLVDLSNAFSTLNQEGALYNIRGLCPATFVTDTYRAPPQLFVAGSKELISAGVLYKVITWAMCVYVPSLQPLISRLQVVSQAKQCWFADDATGVSIATEDQGVVG